MTSLTELLRSFGCPEGREARFTEEEIATLRQWEDDRTKRTVAYEAWFAEHPDDVLGALTAGEAAIEPRYRNRCFHDRALGGSCVACYAIEEKMGQHPESEDEECES